MSEETRVLALFEAANPVPDEQTTGHPSTEPAAYLATLRTRSSEVTQQETKHEESTPSTKRWIWAAAALLAVVIGVVAALTSRGSEETPVVSQPATTQAETPTTETETPTTKVEETEVTEDPGSVPDARLDGSWRSTGVELTFDNGRYELGAYIGPNPADIVDQGTYTTDGDDQLTLVSSGAGLQDCAPGDSRTLSYVVVPGESLTITGGGDECVGRGNLIITPLELTPRG